MWFLLIYWIQIKYMPYINEWCLNIDKSCVIILNGNDILCVDVGIVYRVVNIQIFGNLQLKNDCLHLFISHDAFVDCYSCGWKLFYTVDFPADRWVIIIKSIVGVILLFPILSSCQVVSNVLEDLLAWTKMAWVYGYKKIFSWLRK